MRGEGGRRGGQGVEGGGQGTRTGSSRRRNEGEHQKTEEAEGKRQTQKVIATGECVREERRLKKEEREMDSAGRWRGETSVAGVHGHKAPQMNSFKYLAQAQALILEQASAATAAAMAAAAKAAAAVSLWQRQRRRQVILGNLSETMWI